MPKKLLVIICFLFFVQAKGQDSLRDAMNIAAEANKLQSERLKIASENMANEQTTATTPGGDPYKRKILFVRNVYDPTLKTNVVKIVKRDFDKKPFPKKYDPYHPAADEKGFVKLPNVQKEVEKIDIMESKLAYEANLSIMETTKSMTESTLEIMR